MNQDSSANKRVGIIGAGISGLYAASVLERQGADVMVFESENRIGGRIYTHRSVEGTAEFGAMRLHPSHARAMKLIKERRLRVRRFVNNNPDAYYLIGNKKVRISDQDTIATMFGADAGDARRAVHQALQTVSRQIREDDLARILDGELTAELRNLDAIALWDLLPNNMPDEAKQFGLVANSLLQYAGASGLEMALSARFTVGDVMYEIDGGMDRLAFALAGSLHGTVLMNQRVKAVHALEDGVMVVSTGPNSVRFDTFDFVICTVPAPAVAQIKFAPELPFTQRMSLQDVHYTAAAKTLVSVKNRVWELEDRIYGGLSITDGLAQNIVYPSDNRAQNYSCLVDNLPAVPATLPRNPLEKDRSNNPSVFCGLYARETAARQFMAFSAVQRDDQVVRILERLHPGIASNITGMSHWCWDLQTATGGGAFAHYLPGQRERVQRHLQKPWPADNARMWFAGEHLSTFHGWIEGALQSVDHVLDQVEARYSDRTTCRLIEA